mmetsp:Transcript_4470/g.14002  ORF Transcript_4470/g.14002 Transcript_4470/m.14002 type:complete len:272 (-) Transcript_4470:719-1534(-)
MGPKQTRFSPCGHHRVGVEDTDPGHPQGRLRQFQFRDLFFGKNVARPNVSCVLLAACAPSGSPYGPDKEGRNRRLVVCSNVDTRTRLCEPIRKLRILCPKCAACSRGSNSRSSSDSSLSWRPTPAGRTPSTNCAACAAGSFSATATSMAVCGDVAACCAAAKSNSSSSSSHRSASLLRPTAEWDDAGSAVVDVDLADTWLHGAGAFSADDARRGRFCCSVVADADSSSSRFFCRFGPAAGFFGRPPASSSRASSGPRRAWPWLCGRGVAVL